MSDKSNVLIASLLRIAREDLDGARLLASRDNRNAIKYPAFRQTFLGAKKLLRP